MTERDMTLSQLFQQSQSSPSIHSKLMESVKILYSQDAAEHFWDQYTRAIHKILATSKTSAAVDNAITFAALIAASVDSEEILKSESFSESILWKVLKFLFEFTNAKNSFVRHNACQLIRCVLQSINSECDVVDKLYDELTDVLFKYLKDRTYGVRIEAVHALSRLQDPSDKTCPVIKEYLFHMQQDPNHNVRKAVLNELGPSKLILKAVVEQTNDVKDIVRKAAYQFLADKVHIRCLTITQRNEVLKRGLTDRSEPIKKFVAQTLIPSWIRYSKDSLLQFLCCLDVEYANDTSALVLDSHFKLMKPDYILDNMNFLNKEKLIPIADITCENAFLWNIACKHLQSLGSQHITELETILPDLPPLCRYIEEVANELSSNEEKKLRMEFILCQLIAITNLHDFIDQSAKQQMVQLVRHLLSMSVVSNSHIGPLVECLCLSMNGNEMSVVCLLLEIISDIQEPINAMDVTVNAIDKRNKDLELARLRVKLLELQDQLLKAVEEENFTLAVEIKSKMKENEAAKKVLTDVKQPTTGKEEDTPQSQQLMKCFSIICEMLKHPLVKTFTPSIESTIESLILPGIQDEDPAIRNQAVQALGLVSLMSKNVSQKQALLLFQILKVDHETVRCTAAKAIFDILLAYGVDVFSKDEEQTSRDDENDNSDSNTDESLNKVISICIKLLDHEFTSLRDIAIEGLGKLLMADRIISSKLLSRLVIMWYNPVLEENTYLRHFLGVFFPAYATNSLHRESLEEAFMPTLRTLMQAPTSSPLSSINTLNVVKFLIELTRNDEDTDSKTSQKEYTVHDNLALRICNEILSDPSSFQTKILVQTLPLLELSSPSTAKDFIVVVEQLRQEIKEVSMLKMVEAFSSHVRKLVGDELPVDTNETNTEALNITVAASQKKSKRRFNPHKTEIFDEDEHV